MSANLSLFDEPASTWERVAKFWAPAAALADRHYSRRTPCRCKFENERDEARAAVATLQADNDRFRKALEATPGTRPPQETR